MNPQPDSPDYRRLFAAAPALLLVLRPDQPAFTIVDASDAYLHATGTQRDRIVGRPLFEVFPDNPADPNATGVNNLRHSLNSVMEKQLPHVMAVQKYDIPRAGDSRGGFEERYWSPVNSPVFGPDGGIAYIIHRVEDVTPYVHLQQKEEAGSEAGETGEERTSAQIRQHARELEVRARDLERLVGDRTEQLRATVNELEAFCYSLSHDMRAPLRAVHGYVDIVLAECGDKIGLPGTDYLKRTLSAVRRMDRLIQDLLLYTRVANQDLVLRPVDTHRLVEEIVRERQEFQDPKAEVMIESPLHPILGHEVSLTQCITNLLDNAVKFVRPGVKPKVRIRTEPAGSRIILWVEDNGIGMEPGAEQRLFKMFQRIHTSGEYEGTGIGLAIVRRATERMQGKAGVHSEMGRGSRFYLELPGVPP